MTRYVAFLRGVNVGGNTMVKTADVCQKLASLGFGDVRGYRQSGNIIFEAAGADPDRVAEEIRAAIRGLIGKDVGVIIRTVEHLREMVRSDPFRGVPSGDVKKFVTFFSAEPDVPALPLRSPGGDAEIVLVRGREAFGLGHLKDGRYGASYGQIEAKLGGTYTTRNWNTIKGIAALPVP